MPFKIRICMHGTYIKVFDYVIVIYATAKYSTFDFEDEINCYMLAMKYYIQYVHICGVIQYTVDLENFGVKKLSKAHTSMSMIHTRYFTMIILLLNN